MAELSNDNRKSRLNAELDLENTITIRVLEKFSYITAIPGSGKYGQHIVKKLDKSPGLEEQKNAIKYPFSAPKNIQFIDKAGRPISTAPEAARLYFSKRPVGSGGQFKYLVLQIKDVKGNLIEIPKVEEPKLPKISTTERESAKKSAQDGPGNETQTASKGGIDDALDELLSGPKVAYTPLTAEDLGEKPLPVPPTTLTKKEAPPKAQESEYLDIEDFDEVQDVKHSPKESAKPAAQTSKAVASFSGKPSVDPVSKAQVKTRESNIPDMDSSDGLRKWVPLTPEQLAAKFGNMDLTPPAAKVTVKNVSKAIEEELWRVVVEATADDQVRRIQKQLDQGMSMKRAVENITDGWGTKLLTSVLSGQASFSMELKKRGGKISEFVKSRRPPVESYKLAKKIIYIMNPDNKLGQFADLTVEFLKANKDNKILKPFIEEAFAVGHVGEDQEDIGVTDKTLTLDQLELRLNSTDKNTVRNAILKASEFLPSQLNVGQDRQAQGKAVAKIAKLAQQVSQRPDLVIDDKQRKQVQKALTETQVRAERRAVGGGYNHQVQQHQAARLQRNDQNHGGGKPK